ncbi:hypothetical protein SARC_01557 [Sphaeroforma arctica JP610]|uniref:Uncharacterized protein n=1 Tax=Sphaeroforma arctica JP610 TaxID=667725 RepID=A0A0L0GBB9_9EUKA|nr:hypothetical protein SARC_01557 [Sphaeroforma arctica JP610]KNC86295.1 hypothetical protein SARC_01557 [Sphaeroforma arctica JP610]|eukprot:XP_014160197.1 hypothetical protein SARC_01557 [Sphaeroforma arctica JP610]
MLVTAMSRRSCLMRFSRSLNRKYAASVVATDQLLVSDRICTGARCFGSTRTVDARYNGASLRISKNQLERGLGPNPSYWAIKGMEYGREIMKEYQEELKREDKQLAEESKIETMRLFRSSGQKYSKYSKKKDRPIEPDFKIYDEDSKIPLNELNELEEDLTTLSKTPLTKSAAAAVEIDKTVPTEEPLDEPIRTTRLDKTMFEPKDGKYKAFEEVGANIANPTNEDYINAIFKKKREEEQTTTPEKRKPGSEK